MVQDYRSDETLFDIINTAGASERKKVTAREILKRRHHSQREAWLARHTWVAVLVTAVAALATLFLRKRT